MPMNNTKANLVDEKGELQNRIARNPCVRCRTLGRPICGCGGGGGGSGGGDDEETIDNSASTDSPEMSKMESIDDSGDDLMMFELQPEDPEPLDESDAIDEDSSEELALQLELEPEELELLLEGLGHLLTVKNDAERGIFTILSVRPFSSPEAQLEWVYIKLIENKLDTIKKELAAEGVKADTIFTMTMQPKSIVLRFPIMAHYDRFINRLNEQRLLELGAKAAKDKTVSDPDIEPSPHLFTPLSTRPVPKGDPRRDK